MEAILLIVLFALFLASGQRRRLFGGDQGSRRVALRDLIWR